MCDIFLFIIPALNIVKKLVLLLLALLVARKNGTSHIINYMNYICRASNTHTHRTNLKVVKKLKKLTSTGVSATSIYESMVLVLGDIAPLLFASFVILIAGWFKVFGFRSSNENDRLSRGSRTVRRSRHGPRTPVPGRSRRRRAPGPNPHNNGTRHRWLPRKGEGAKIKNRQT